MHVFRLTALAAPFLLLQACATLPEPQPAAVPDVPTRGLVSAADPRAAEAGAQMLRQGGSATDAAIATMLALTVVEPQSSGIGGGGFFVRGTPDGNVVTIDGRETAPSGAEPDWFLGPDGRPLGFMDAVISGRSVGVPGNMRLAEQAHRRFGKLPWATLFEPAIALAHEGWTLTARARGSLSETKDRAAHHPEGLALFYDAAGEPLPVGTRITNPALAATLEAMARGGADWFYSGSNAAQLAERVAAETPRAGALTAKDIGSYEAKPRTPVCGDYRGFRICGMGPPSSGATTVFAILKQLEGFDLGALGPRSPAFWHLFAEAQRLAYADRGRYLADPDFVAVPVDGLTDPHYLKARGALISAERAMPTASAGVPPGAAAIPPAGTGPEESGTSHFVAIDRDGSVVSYTSTIEGAFGSGIMVGGYYLNNELTDFSFVPQEGGRPVANRVEGGKRPRSSMSPTIVYDHAGRPFLAVGAAGGSTIPVQVARALIGVLDFGLPIGDALALPVLYSPGNTVVIEPGTWLTGLIPALAAYGHEVAVRPLPLKANAAIRTEAGWIGAGDPRSDGTAVSE